MEGPRCTNCGTVNMPAANWCYNCGGSLAPQGSGYTPTVYMQPPADQSPAPANPYAAAAAQTMWMCVQHPNVPAIRQCDNCGVAICSTCDFAMPRPGSAGTLNISADLHLCPTCVSARNRAVSSPTAARQIVPLPLGVMCAYHPQVNAVRRCNVCSKPVCPTCDFEMPGYFHVCPECASKPQTEMSPKRKKNLVISYVLAVVATVGLAIVFSGALSDTVRTQKDAEMVIGLALQFFVFVPSIIGVALGISCFDKRLANPPVIWGAAVWNGLIVAAMLVLTFIGLASR